MAISDTHFSIKERGNLFNAEFGHMINDGAVVINEGLIFKVYKDRVEIKGRDFATHTDIAYWEIPYNTGDLNEGQIGTALDETKVLDKNGDNEVTLYGSHDGTNQRWEFVYDKDKAAYQIKSVRDKDLVLAWNVVPNSRQVFATPNQYKEEQYWILEKLGDYYIIKSKKDLNLVLDVEGSKTDNLTKL
ncbi:hypothetical protein B7C51_22970 [Paenibacillus larvae subsp. pulvifaciens]|uniref:Ricin B lectin domain-containing protein n=1 Tax=Paenibacillus larvae subsp. pulvifaciens TaxID=1477 RepID=A0A1V0UY58_9BACL|nr:RICIN domain-containing protein [Paenibacillus larvae]ARF70093.1 hypothetical protein B7C51_22970 [Paenibacillus larvae subsp. pulvifaciens]